MSEKIDELFSKCVKCGRCKSVCPTYSIIQTEWGVARGRIAMAQAIHEGKIKASDTLQEHIGKCLMCMACEEICTSQTPVVEIIKWTRGKIEEEIGLPFKERIILRLLKEPSFLEKLIKMGAISSPFIGKSQTLYRGIVLRIPPFKGYLFPLSFSSHQFRGKVFGEKKKESIGLFLGCLLEFLYPDVIEKVIKILTNLGYQVVIPDEQTCCGHPHLATGDKDAAQKLARKNKDAFEKIKIDKILTACATCTSHIKNFYNLSTPVVDFAELIIKEAHMLKSSDAKLEPFTYHEPCHLKRAQGIKEIPEVLNHLFPELYKEMPDYDRCCGFGGIAVIEYPEISSKIGSEKAENIKQSNAKIVVTCCPACMLQIENALFATKVKAKTIHLAELFLCS